MRVVAPLIDSGRGYRFKRKYSEVGFGPVQVEVAVGHTGGQER